VRTLCPEFDNPLSPVTGAQVGFLLLHNLPYSSGSIPGGVPTNPFNGGFRRRDSAPGQGLGLVMVIQGEEGVADSGTYNLQDREGSFTPSPT
jgi:hypothetical protein